MPPSLAVRASRRVTLIFLRPGDPCRQAGHDLWLVDTQGMSLVTHRLDADSADTVLANAIGGTSSATPATFLLRGGDAYILTPDLRSAPALWLSLGDGHHIVQLLATIP